MRNWINIFEADFNHEEESRDNALYAREQVVAKQIMALCMKAGFDLDDTLTPVVYDEEDNRSVLVRVSSSVTLEQLNALTTVGSNISVSRNPNRSGVLVEFNVSKHLDPNITSIR